MAMTPIPALDRTASSFKTDVDTFFGTRIPTFTTEANAIQADIATKQTAAATSATNAATSEGNALVYANAASTSAGTATTQATNAASSASSALNAPGTSATSTTSLTVGLGAQSLTLAQTGKLYSVGQTVVVASSASPTNQMIGAITAFNSGTGAMTINATSIAGSGTFAAWTVALSGPQGAASLPTITRVPRTANTILSGADLGKLFAITSGTFTQTYTAAATLGAGWWCKYVNEGSGTVTHDPNASETIQGDVTLAMYPGEAWTITCDGTAFNVVRDVIGSGGYIKVCEQQTAATNSADSITAAASVGFRTLNTVKHNTLVGASLASNAVTLTKAGTYRIRARAPATRVNAAPQYGASKHRIALHDGTTDLLSGSSTAAGWDSSNNYGAVTDSKISGLITITTSTTLKIRHFVGNYDMSGGLATGALGSFETYTELEIERIA